ncbi:hypothetical protein A2631_04630 [Candidatus Daviesbacteria bacterium RIFCSPHIGHO2_01_FULL_44_29]|uniref:Uncharacterized protein n=1 Tax=Candidatus Daviesbacteria bacterium RIFCSPHIGHO2_02_FULL_43_12 TaxID=1797776 RepID=A0A1F5KGF0_9BACT|nr:MAG: hypothetical protein A2631_04630 [Candidatus Daviesbacteria bacterium RIFCSPHIGHO2_01_FULL_44_29]OGE40006.1 MAG: hypothetical protein A3D25_04360 [Candidatus Daviesbacteria bacterium RIFCSPHIGHO2_02_FULL_43_12]OGE41510.1 MAG: hypothetical protein A3E86_05450 [Candidatus Daviesbacteria bacterium RIFCSPHIGHO2_12_FULL_47_45]OGE70313.1 MAG: hypothetical protein A3B55_01210 [Candidatus Daviesbacteria bacterium RIFCSPLOWO2_01_FULL_43_15]
MAYSGESLVKTSKQVVAQLRSLGISTPSLEEPVGQFLCSIAADAANSTLAFYFRVNQDGTRPNFLVAISDPPVDISNWSQWINKYRRDRSQLLLASHAQLRYSLQPHLLCSLDTPRGGELDSIRQAMQRIQPGGIYRAWPYTRYELLAFLDLHPSQKIH